MFRKGHMKRRRIHKHRTIQIPGLGLGYAYRQGELFCKELCNGTGLGTALPLKIQKQATECDFFQQLIQLRKNLLRIVVAYGDPVIEDQHGIGGKRCWQVADPCAKG